MARRSRDWNAGLAKDLQNQEFAREFLLAAMDEGVPVQVALAKVVRATGLKEFAAKVGMASPNVLRAIDRRYNPTQRTLNRLLRPFNLRLSLARIARHRHAAYSGLAHYDSLERSARNRFGLPLEAWQSPSESRGPRD